MLIADLQYLPRILTDGIKNHLNLSEDETAVYDLAIKDKTITEISLALQMSTATVSRRLQSIRYKIKLLILTNSNGELL